MNIPTMAGLAEASKQTGLSYDFLRKLCLQNKIVYVRAGARYFVNMEKLAEFLNQGEGKTDVAGVTVCAGANGGIYKNGK